MYMMTFGREEWIGVEVSPTGLDGGVYVAQAPNYANPRSYSLAEPIGGYGGVKFTF